EDRAVGDIAHGDVADADVFQQCAVHGLERQPPAGIEDAVGDGDVFESAVGFGAKLDPTGAGASLADFVSAVEESSHLPAAHLAVGDGDVFAWSRPPQRI